MKKSAKSPAVPSGFRACVYSQVVCGDNQIGERVNLNDAFLLDPSWNYTIADYLDLERSLGREVLASGGNFYWFSTEREYDRAIFERLTEGLESIPA